MAKENTKQKKLVKVTAQAVPEIKQKYNGDYTGYFYNQIGQLWNEVAALQQENNELKARIRGEY